MKPLGDSGKEGRWVHTACSNCMVAPMRARLKNGKIAEIKGEDIPCFNEKICGKAISGIATRVYGPHRILYPLKRVGERGEAKFVRCTWEEVVDAVAARLRKYIDAGHPEYFEIWWGGNAENIFFLHYWSTVLKTGISYLHGQACFGDHAVEKMVTFGANHGPALMAGVADWTRTKYALVAGQNFPGTAAEAGGGCRVPTYFLANRAKENGCQFVSLDPKLADSSPWCHEWIPIRPGGDALFALSVANVLIKEKLYDEDFLLCYTNAAQLLREENGEATKDCKGRYLTWNDAASSAIPMPEAGKGIGLALGLAETYKVAVSGETLRCNTVFQRLAEEAERHTIPDPYMAQKAVEVARKLAKHRPAVVFYPGFTSGRYPNWFQTIRAYSVVNLLLGNFDTPGGFYFTKHNLDLGTGWPEPPEVPEYREGVELVPAPLGNQMSAKNIDKKPCYKKPPEFHPATAALPWLHFNAIEQGKVRAVLSTGENTAASQPNSKRVLECLKKLDLIVVGEQLPKEFVDLADYVLPEVSYVERNQLHMNTFIGTDNKEHITVYMRSAVMPRLGGSRPLSWFMVEVAKRLGFSEHFEKLDLNYAWWDRMLKKAGLYPKVSSRKLIEEGPYTEAHAMNYNLLFKPIATRSGRFEIYSNELAEDCYYNLKSQWYQNQHVCPLPVYVHIAEPHGDEEFYLVCGKATWHQKNSTRHDGYLMEYGLEGGCPYTRIYVNADRARKLGIDDGDLVEVECIGPREKDDACVLDEAVVGVKETVRVKVTEGLHPEAAWVYFGGGHRSNSMLTKGREGIVHNWFVPSTASPYAGGVGKNYSIVKIRKLLNLRN